MAQGWNPGPGSPGPGYGQNPPPGYGQNPPPGYGQNPPPPGYGQHPPPPKKSNAGLIIGIVVGVLALIGGGIGIASYVAVSGLNRYKQSAKTADAKNTLGTLSRNAMSAYEYERFDELASDDASVSHVLCKSATPVPATIPKGTRYQPSSLSGQDFETGTSTEGWKCLRFSSTTPTHYQYDYRVGGKYKGPSRGGPDPGPDGFEVSAEGDLDGDGVTSLFTITGKVDKVSKTVKLAPLWSVDEGE
jgi:hypothetical protein